eukprot:comp6918_c0_seq1/m.2656 comp6918_c0_seq1/g.2656  ORF comp6918_c0_seq1/g.2656 comp6918_c0_seq1/m.2656 type:complete len:292 (-) comp6918_c0_seq1:79-954(-)
MAVDDFHYDPPRDFDILLRIDPPAKLGEPHFEAKLSTAYNRVPHPVQSLEDDVERIWEEKQRKMGKALWNATKFRLHAVETVNGKCTIKLGVTDYKTFQGTNMSSTSPLSTFCSTDHLSMNLGCACYVTTRDNMVAFILRSSAVGEGEGMAALPGGHGEPSRLGINKITDLDDSKVNQAALMEELYVSILLEAVEELHVDRSHFEEKNMEMVGLVQRTHDCRPQLVMRVKCDLSLREIEDGWRVKSAQEEHSEAVRLIFVHESEIAEAVRTGVVKGEVLMPEHRGALRLFV